MAWSGDFMPPGLYNMDCMDALRRCPDKYFDLAIVDPPYGGGAKGDTAQILRGGGAISGLALAGALGAGLTATISARVSREQIIWGGNYFGLPPTRCFIVWDKMLGEHFSMAMCEYAWTSFDANAALYRCAPQGTAKQPRIHPTQKPVALYAWLLGRYARAGDKILDTHAGSASLLVACRRAGFDAWGYEIDPVYYALAQERLTAERAQTTLFDALGGA